MGIIGVRYFFYENVCVKVIIYYVCEGDLFRNKVFIDRIELRWGNFFIMVDKFICICRRGDLIIYLDLKE